MELLFAQYFKEMSKMENNKEMLSDKVKDAYMLSLEAYRFSVHRHREWMYLYAIICGALFIAFYSIETKNIKEVSEGLFNLLSFLLPALGVITSFFWILSFRGHYEWTKNFIRIVDKNERLFFGKENKPELFVYSKVIPETKPGKDTHYLPGFFSTQKVTLIYLIILMFAWEILLLYKIYRMLKAHAGCDTRCIIMTFVIILSFMLVYVACSKRASIMTNRFFSSYINEIDEVKDKN